MILPDVNILVYAHRPDAVDHAGYAAWLVKLVDDAVPFAMADSVLASFVRVVTNPRIYKLPTPVGAAFATTDAIRSAPSCVLVSPGERHWTIFEDLCRRTRTAGADVSDAWLAALAIESNVELATNDHGFARFPGLRWRHPLD